MYLNCKNACSVEIPETKNIVIRTRPNAKLSISVEYIACFHFHLLRLHGPGQCHFHKAKDLPYSLRNFQTVSDTLLTFNRYAEKDSRYKCDSTHYKIYKSIKRKIEIWCCLSSHANANTPIDAAKQPTPSPVTISLDGPLILTPPSYSSSSSTSSTHTPAHTNSMQR